MISCTKNPKPREKQALGDLYERVTMQALVGATSRREEDGALLDPIVWRDLPSELQLRILNFLPLRALGRFVAVSKVWYHAVRSIKRVAAAPGSWIINQGFQGFSLLIYSSDEEEWLTLPLDFLPPVYSQGWVSASAGGLVCFDTDNVPDRFLGIAVCNPLTRCWIELPSIPGQQYKVGSFLFIGIQSTDVSYGVVCLKHSGWKGWSATHVCHVYDSRSATWNRESFALEEGELFMGNGGNHILSCAALHSSILYFVTGWHRGFSFSLRSFNVLTGSLCKLATWTSLPLLQPGFQTGPWAPPGIPPHCWESNPKLVICAGKLVLVGLEEFSSSTKGYTIGLVAFNSSEEKWEPFGCCAPQWVVGDLHDYTGLAASASQSQIFVCIGGWERVVYDFSKNSWFKPSGECHMFKAFPLEHSFARNV